MTRLASPRGKEDSINNFRSSSTTQPKHDAFRSKTRRPRKSPPPDGRIFRGKLSFPINTEK